MIWEYVTCIQNFCYRWILCFSKIGISWKPGVIGKCVFLICHFLLSRYCSFCPGLLYWGRRVLYPSWLLPLDYRKLLPLGCWLLPKWACPIQWLCRNEVMVRGGFVIHGTYYQVRVLGDKIGKIMYFSTETNVWCSDVSFHTVTGPLSPEGNLDPVPQPPFTPPPFAFMTCGYGKFCVCFRVCFFSSSGVSRGSWVFARGEGGLSFFDLAQQYLPGVSQYPLKPCSFADLFRTLAFACALRISAARINESPRVGWVCYLLQEQMFPKKKSLLREVREVLRCLKKFITWNHKKTVRHTLYRP